MKLNLSANKEDFDLNRWAFLQLVKKLDSNKLHSFRKITQILGPILHLTREEILQLLKNWETRGWIVIIPYKGVLIKGF